MNSIPMVRLTVESMQFEMKALLGSHVSRIFTEIEKSVEKVCTPENIERIIDAEASQALESLIREEMRNFYTKGDGRKYVVEKMVSYLNAESAK